MTDWTPPTAQEFMGRIFEALRKVRTVGLPLEPFRFHMAEETWQALLLEHYGTEGMWRATYAYARDVAPVRRIGGVDVVFDDGLPLGEIRLRAEIVV